MTSYEPEVPIELLRVERATAADSYTEMPYELVRALIERAGPGVITKIVPFLNDDVPQYLEKLRKFEDESRKASFVVGGGV